MVCIPREVFDPVQAFVRIGLALLLVVAPALCCCKNPWLMPAVHATTPVPATDCPSCPATVTAVHSCCHEAAAPEADPSPANAAPTPERPAPLGCACCLERPVAAPNLDAPAAESLRLSDACLPAVWVVPPAVAPEHAGLRAGLDPPARSGADARSAALFDRHVMRC